MTSPLRAFIQGFQVMYRACRFLMSGHTGAHIYDDVFDGGE